MRQIVLALCVLASTDAAFGQDAAPSGRTSAPAAPRATAPSTITLAEQERFLLGARIEKVRGVKEGATGTQRATLTDGAITHDASIQTIDESVARYETAQRVEFNFRDYWGYNVAAYRLGVMLGLDNIPPSVARVHRKPQGILHLVDRRRHPRRTGQGRQEGRASRPDVVECAEPRRAGLRRADRQH